jgi:hypothetical protein
VLCAGAGGSLHPTRDSVQHGRWHDRRRRSGVEADRRLGGRRQCPPRFVRAISVSLAAIRWPGVIVGPPDRVYAPVDAVKPAARHSMLDRSRPQPHRHQLRRAEDAMLAIGQLGDFGVRAPMPLRFCLYVMAFLIRIPHPTPSARTQARPSPEPAPHLSGDAGSLHRLHRSSGPARRSR